jgi:hypothetical protein
MKKYLMVIARYNDWRQEFFIENSYSCHEKFEISVSSAKKESVI